MSTQTFSIRINSDLLQRIDASAEARGESRSTYILSWLPEFYDEPASTPHSATPNPATSHGTKHRE